MHPPINIFSGEQGLGAALTNPTQMARLKGRLDRDYPVTYRGVLWPDVESAYKTLARDEPSDATRQALMVELIALKFRQHPGLREEVVRRGGAQWLSACSHFTGARTERAQRWEGQGLESPFIQALMAGFERSATPVDENGQPSLF